MKVLLLIFLVSSCNYKIQKGIQEREVTIPGEMLEKVSYQQLKQEVLEPKCITCHGSAGGVNLESHSEAHKHIDAIRKTVLEAKTMPKAPLSPLNDHQFELITAWVDAGGPDRPIGHGDNGPDAPTGETRPDDGKLSFQKIKDTIITKKCLSCHTAGEHAGNIPFDSREQLLSSSLKLIVPGNPQESLFYKITSPGVMNMMPPYPVKPLSPAQRKMIQTWILEGAN